MSRRILLVEDNLADIEMLRVAFEDAGTLVALESVRDGRQAKAILEKIASGASSFDLIVLDINVPIVSGLDLLELIKNDPALRATPTVILTSSDRAQDRARAGALAAEEYLLKPRDLTGYDRIAKVLESYLARPSADLTA
jgi:two-component system, chemotaxis family, response regulator Rcp1